MCSPYFSFYPVQIALVVAFLFKQPKWIRNTCTPYGGRRVWGRMLCVSRLVTWCLLGTAYGVFDLFIRTSIWDSPDHTQREERLLSKGFVAGKLRIMIINKFSSNFDRNSCRIHHCLSIIGRQCEYLLTYSMEQSPSWEANWFCI
jgi:hypothetical protein